MTIPVISSLPEIPAYSDANFETKAPAVLSALRNTFIAEMNAAIAAINAYDYGSAVNANIITGQVAVINGGTGLSTLAAGRIPYGAGTSVFGNSGNFGYNGDGRLYIYADAVDKASLVLGNSLESSIPLSSGFTFYHSGTGGGTGRKDGVYIRRGAVDGDSISLAFGAASGNFRYVGGRITHFRSGSNGNGGLAFEVKNDASIDTTTEAMRILANGNVGIGATTPSTKLHVNGPARVGSYTVATVPNASTAGDGSMIYVTDDVGGAVIAFSDGTNWLRVTDRATVSTT